MEEQPSKRRGRPRKVVDVPDDGAEVQGAANADAGDGQAGEVGASAQADDGRAREWLAFKSRVIEAMGKRGRGFTEVTHPAPEEVEIVGEWAVKVSIGPESV